MLKIANRRLFSTKSILDVLREKVPQKQESIKKIVKEHGEKSLGTVTVSSAIGGMRGLNCMFWDLSKLDNETGIRFQGMQLNDAVEQLRKTTGGEPKPEHIFQLLLTGDLPDEAQRKMFITDLVSRMDLDKQTVDLVSQMPKDLHPMAKLAAGMLLLQKHSKFAKAQAAGTKKSDLWEFMLEDSLDLTAKTFTLGALIHNTHQSTGKGITVNPKVCLTDNFCQMIGKEDKGFSNLMKLYFSIHTDHEGGNVSAHTSHLVGSALSDAYYSTSAAMGGLAGPLHGLANQEVLVWLEGLVKDIGLTPTDAQLEEYINATLKSGRVVPGYGHAVLRATDPRQVVQADFAKMQIKDDKQVDLVTQCQRVIPSVLGKVGKIKNPWPNVDAHSGVLLRHYGFDKYDFQTVLFGLSRTIGCVSHLVWARALGLPIERPNSFDTETLLKMLK